MTEPLLKIENFSCGYSSFKIERINFSLPKGIFAGIIGPNGSGKTTLFRGIMGILPTLKGQISLNGKNMNSFSLKQRAQHIAIVSQSTDNDDIPVEDYVMMGRYPYFQRFQFFETKYDRELAYRYMKKTDIFQHRHKLISELSGGEQQRAAIARALTQQPDLLLLDEPTSHLDIAHQVSILDLIGQLNKDFSLTVLMIIHDLNAASEYCDKLILLNKGKIHSQGTTEEVVTYQKIEEVYKTPVVIQKNPCSGKPAVFIVSGNLKATNK